MGEGVDGMVGFGKAFRWVMDMGMGGEAFTVSGSISISMIYGYGYGD